MLSTLPYDVDRRLVCQRTRLGWSQARAGGPRRAPTVRRHCPDRAPKLNSVRVLYAGQLGPGKLHSLLSDRFSVRRELCIRPSIRGVRSFASYYASSSSSSASSTSSIERLTVLTSFGSIRTFDCSENVCVCVCPRGSTVQLIRAADQTGRPVAAAVETLPSAD